MLFHPSMPSPWRPFASRIERDEQDKERRERVDWQTAKRLRTEPRAVTPLAVAVQGI
jgi:hypothetical protein